MIQWYKFHCPGCGNIFIDWDYIKLVRPCTYCGKEMECMVELSNICRLNGEDKNKISEFFEDRNIQITQTDVLELIDLVNEMVQAAHEAKK